MLGAASGRCLRGAVRMIGWSARIGGVFAVVLLPISHVWSARVQ